MEHQLQKEEGMQGIQQDMGMEAQETGPMKIEMLQSHGVNIKDIEKLQAAGLYTIEAVCYSTLKTLTQIKGITDAKASKLLETGCFFITSVIAITRIFSQHRS